MTQEPEIPDRNGEPGPTAGNDHSHTCANCYIGFSWEPVVSDGDEYCCAGCAEGGPCVCTYGAPPHEASEAPSEDESPDPLAAKREILMAAVAELRQPVREAAALRVEQGLSDQEIAERLDISADDVRDRLTEGRQTIERTVGAEFALEHMPVPEQEAQASDTSDLREGAVPAGHGDEASDESAEVLAARRDVVMGAVAEMPVPIQDAVALRVEEGLDDQEIAERLGISSAETLERLSQGRLIIERTLGPGFTVEHIRVPEQEPGAAPRAVAPPPEALPPFETARDETTGPPGTGAAPEAGPRWDAEIARTLGGLVARSEHEGEDTRGLVSEAFRDASELFRMAAEHIQSGAGQARPSRQALAETGAGSVTIVVERPGDPSAYFEQLLALEPVISAQMTAFDQSEATFLVASDSLTELVRALMSMEGASRPSRLRLRQNEIRVELSEPVTGHMAGPPGARAQARRPAGPQFEMTVEAFFGARHFITSGDSQGPPHHHSYRVEAGLSAASQDENGFVLGFAEVRDAIESIVGDFNESLLNTRPEFIEDQPTAENIARVIHGLLSERLGDQSSLLTKVRVWESPTSSASYSDAAATG